MKADKELLTAESELTEMDRNLYKEQKKKKRLPWNTKE